MPFPRAFFTHRSGFPTLVGTLLSGAVLSAALLPGCRSAGPGARARQLTPIVGQWLDNPVFDPATFQNPSATFGPYTRWWWPGGDVDSTELRREVQLLAAQGFAGAEVEPFSNGLNPKSRVAEVQSWDSPAFYANVRAMLRQARQSGFTIDLNAGSGWPLGGSWVAPADGMLTLTHADTVVAGGQSLAVSLPHRLPLDLSSIQFSSARPAPSEFDLKLSKVQAVVGARIIGEPGAKQTQLDPTSVVDLTQKVSGCTLRWQVPPTGKWVIVALYSVPDQQSVITSAAPGTPLVVNHFDSTRLAASYEHLLGPRTGLRPFFGNPLRAVFNDSYEFKTDRHFADDFLAYFQRQRGYDPRPWLLANLQPSYNNAYGMYMAPGAVPRFQFSDGQDWRRRYDYDQTVGDLFRQQFIASSNRWMAHLGLLHRTQAYGLKMDVIAGSGTAAIPEAEQLAYGGSEAVVKLVSSGAHLYNRPLVTEEAFVYQNRAEMTTPQKMKAAADKSFAAGVTQLIYHGTPYKYQTADFGREGWNTFSSPFMGFVSFASGLNETDPFWADLKEVNRYVARAQYALRAGRPHTDVLIYFPSFSFTDDHILPNPEEILVGGYLPGVEPVTAGMIRNAPKKGKDPELDQTREWFEKVWPVVNALEAAGITWEWVNDASLQAATTQNGRLNIRGNAYQAVLLADAPWLETASAQRLNGLAQAGAAIVSVGQLPAVQPNFREYATNDQLMTQALRQALQGKASQRLATATDLATWARALPQPIGFAQAHLFTRSIERELPDGSSIRFVCNKTDQWQALTLKAGPGFGGLYWLDATSGVITKANPQQLTYQLPPYGSIFLYAAKNALSTKLLTAPHPVPAPDGKVLATLNQWTIAAGDTSVTNSPLFDWRTHPSYKSKSVPGRYTTTFIAPKLESGKHYFLDLGQVNYTAQVRLNGQAVANLLWAPYQVDVTQQLKAGPNTLEVLVTPSRRNEFVTQGVRGNPHYAQFKTARKTLTPAGLVGPVVLKSR